MSLTVVMVIEMTITITITIIVAIAVAAATIKNVEEVSPVVTDTTNKEIFTETVRRNTVFCEVVGSYYELLEDLKYAVMHKNFITPYNKGLIEGGLASALEILEETSFIVYDEDSFTMNEKRKEIIKNARSCRCFR